MIYFTDDWWSRGQCKGEDPALFEIPNNKAKKICAACPVREECLQHAMDSPWVPYGIWAGLSQKEVRRQWRERHPRASYKNLESFFYLGGVS